MADNTNILEDYEGAIKRVEERREAQHKQSLADLQAMADEQKAFDEQMKALGNKYAEREDRAAEERMLKKIEEAKAKAEAEVRARYRKTQGLRPYTASISDTAIMDLAKALGDNK